MTEEAINKEALGKDLTNDAKKEDEIKVNPDLSTLSKRQLRKLKRKENVLKYRAEKRLKERERKKERRKQLRSQGQDLGPSKKQLKRNTMAQSSCRVKVVIDCSFDHLMTEKDIMKLTQQINHSYSANRRASNPLQYYVTSFCGKSKTRMEGIGDYKSWDVNFHEEDYVSMFGKENVVYLSSESDNVLSTLDPDKAYVIGGLVDHNYHKGLCHKLAEEKGIAHAQLPIAEYLNMKSRKVLTINHVFEILLRFTETDDWKESMYPVLPKRKGAEVKTSTDDVLNPDRDCDKHSSDDKSDCNSDTDDEREQPKKSKKFKSDNCENKEDKDTSVVAQNKTKQPENS